MLFTVCVLKAARDDELQKVSLHLVRLVQADRGFEREQVLSLDACRFGQDLPPAILAGAFDTEHCQMKWIKPLVSVLFLSREQKVRL